MVVKVAESTFEVKISNLQINAVPLLAFNFNNNKKELNN